MADESLSIDALDLDHMSRITELGFASCIVPCDRGMMTSFFVLHWRNLHRSPHYSLLPRGGRRNPPMILTCPHTVRSVPENSEVDRCQVRCISHASPRKRYKTLNGKRLLRIEKINSGRHSGQDSFPIAVQLQKARIAI